MTDRCAECGHTFDPIVLEPTENEYLGDLCPDCTSRLVDARLPEAIFDAAVNAISTAIRDGDRNAQDGNVHDRRHWLKERAELIRAGDALHYYSRAEWSPDLWDYERFGS